MAKQTLPEHEKPTAVEFNIAKQALLEHVKLKENREADPLSVSKTLENADTDPSSKSKTLAIENQMLR